MNELFWVATQLKFRKNEVPAEKEEEISGFPSYNDQISTVRAALHVVSSRRWYTMIHHVSQALNPSLFIEGHSSLFEPHLSSNSKKLIHELGRRKISLISFDSREVGFLLEIEWKTYFLPQETLKVGIVVGWILTRCTFSGMQTPTFPGQESYLAYQSRQFGIGESPQKVKLKKAEKTP